MEKLRVLIPVLVASTLLAAAPAFADTLVITYRSGKVQQVVMEEASAEVSSIAYVSATVPGAPESKVTKPPAVPERKPEGAAGPLPAKELPGRTEGGNEASGAGKGRPPETPKPGFRIKWAPPVNE
jgi:hypothetical protein